MGWPSPQDYQEAVQNPETAFDDPDLRGCEIELDALEMPKPRSGNFAVVYKATGRGKTWAVRCFLREVQSQNERYAAIAAELNRLRLPFTTGFTYLPGGIRVGGARYPLLKMEWVQGDGLIQYITQHLRSPQRLTALADAITGVVGRLSAHRLAHGDLQHGNILVVNHCPILIDYDGMYVPAIHGRGATGEGHRNYQHPKRASDHFGPGLDNFALWVIALSLKGLAADPGLWARHDGGEDCLLLRRRDFEAPDQSTVLGELERSRDFLVGLHGGWFRQLSRLDPLGIPAYGVPPVGVSPPRPPVSPPESPSPSPSGASLGGASWIQSHLMAAGGRASVDISAGVRPPAVSVPAVFTSPAPSTFQPPPPPAPGVTPELPKRHDLKLELDTNPEVEHAALLGTVFATMAVIALVLTNVFAWPVGVLVGLAVVGALFGLLRHRYRRARVEAVRECAQSIREIEALVAGTRGTLRVLTDQWAMIEQEKEQWRESLTLQLQVAQADFAQATQELAAQREAAAISLKSQRDAAEKRFRAEQDSVRTSAQVQLEQLSRYMDSVTNTRDDGSNQLNGLADTEAAVADALRKVLVAQADEHYFGPALRDVLISEAISTAADISTAIFSIPDIGPLRGSAALSWRRAVEGKIRAALQASPMANGVSKRAEFDQQLTQLVAARQACEEERDRLEREVASRRSAELEALDRTAGDTTRMFDLALQHLTEQKERATAGIQTQLDELEQLPQLSMWATHISAQQRLLRRVEKLLSFAQQERAAAVAADRRFRARTHPGKVVEETSPGLTLSTAEIPQYDPENFTIVSCDQSDWDLAVKVMGSGRMGRLGTLVTSFQGEVNETNEKGKCLSKSASDGPLILRGSNVCLYVLREASQGERVYLQEDRFFAGKSPEAKAFHSKQDRIGFQRSAPQNNFRRIIAAWIPANSYCFDTVSYIPERETKLPLLFVLGLLNSTLLDWYFRLGSTNSKLNEYQFNNLPCPVFAPKPSASDKGVQAEVIAALGAGRVADALKVLRRLLDTPPFSVAVREAVIEAVKRIMAIERKRGEITRRDRSALDPGAQPYQDFIDQLLYGMAGLTEEEIKSLEVSYAKML